MKNRRRNEKKERMVRKIRQHRMTAVNSQRTGRHASSRAPQPNLQHQHPPFAQVPFRIPFQADPPTRTNG